jgi:signal transduction histidine kinase
MTAILLVILLFFQPISQDTTDEYENSIVPVLHDSLTAQNNSILYLTQLDGWEFTTGNPYDSTAKLQWTAFDIAEDGTSAVLDSLWKGFGWYRLQFRVDSSFSLQTSIPVLDPMIRNLAIEVYLDDKMIYKVGNPSREAESENIVAIHRGFGNILNFTPGQTYDLKVKRSFHKYGVYDLLVPFSEDEAYAFTFALAGPEYLRSQSDAVKRNLTVFSIVVVAIFLLCILYLSLYFRVKDQKENLWLVLLMFCIGFFAFSNIYNAFTLDSFWLGLIYNSLNAYCLSFSLTLIPLVTYKLLKLKVPLVWGLYAFIGALFYIYDLGGAQINEPYLLLGISVFGGLYALYTAYKKGSGNLLLPALSILGFPLILIFVILLQFLGVNFASTSLILVLMAFLTLPIGLSLYQAKKFLRLHNEMDDLVDERTAELEKAYKQLEQSLSELKAAQDQLVQQEKLASLGQLTAGIAHEIKNPLNFVNNFSDLSVELVEETREELLAVSDQLSTEGREKVDEALEILNDIETNLRKIHQHGTRADSIVKSMLEHSRGGLGIMEPTDLNSLLKEYVNLSFHGMRAGKDPINVDLEFDLDEDIGEVPLIAEDFSRVIINLSNNAFDAMREKMSADGGQLSENPGQKYSPKLTIRTLKENQATFIEIQDNGQGIPKEIKDKILQPFFTTKKGTEGTGLGLSITNDIIKAHGGSLEVITKQNEGTTFTIKLPIGG